VLLGGLGVVPETVGLDRLLVVGQLLRLAGDVKDDPSPS
jgi:hypothetical protein